MSYPIGTVLTRREPQGDALDEIKIVGGDNKSLSIQPAKEFGAVERRSAAAVRVEYTTEENLEHSQEFGQPSYVDPGKTPEELFADAARASDEPVKPNASANVAAANKIAEAAEVAAEADAAKVEPEAVTVEEPQDTPATAPVAEPVTENVEVAEDKQGEAKTASRRGRKPRGSQS